MSADEASPVEWRPGEPPRSRRFGDIYYSRDDGLAEARQVFLAGCGLPDAWNGRRNFSVGELGFGTGLNIAALIDLWRREGPADGHLSIFSVEADPVAANDAARALASWPELADIAAALTGCWPGRARGFHRIELPRLRVSFDLAVMEAGEALAAWSGPADAWFLDGFAPALNPEIWRPEILALIGRRSAAGARLATYTVAGQVRRDLTAAGFAVERKAGFGAKRQRLEARWPGEAIADGPAPRVAIIGGGIAGASLARAFAAHGAQTVVVDDAGPAASGGPAALVAPRLDAGLGPTAALFAQAVRRAGDLYGGGPRWVISRGAIQLAIGPKDSARFATIAASNLFEPGAMRVVGGPEASARIGESAPSGLSISPALVVDPAPILAAWLGRPTRGAVARIAHEAGLWTLFDEAGSAVTQAEIVCLAAGLGSAALAPGVALRAVRGQASLANSSPPPVTVLFGGYLAPTGDGAIFGATHDRDDHGQQPRAGDHRRNLAALAAVLPAAAARLGAAGPLRAHVGVRATTTDYLPLAGPLAGPPGLFTLTGLGSRGFTLAPLLAEHIAAQALNRPSPLPTAIAALVEPARFAARARRRGRPAVESPGP